jgi:hypothetical protein
MSKEIQLHEWNIQPLLTDKAITRVKGQTCVNLLSKKLLGRFSLIQREVGISREKAEDVRSTDGRSLRSSVAETLLLSTYATVQDTVGHTWKHRQCLDVLGVSNILMY